MIMVSGEHPDGIRSKLATGGIGDGEGHIENSGCGIGMGWVLLG